jgi:hypothetical protein
VDISEFFQNEFKNKNFIIKMNMLHIDLMPIIMYDNGVYKRCDNILVKNNKFEEFLYVLETQYGYFNKKDWKAEPYSVYHTYESCQPQWCVCTKKIHNLCYITHIPSSMTWLVGIDCIKKIDYNLGKEVEQYVRIEKNRQNGNICGYCTQTLTDLRKKYQRDGWCNEFCYMKRFYTIPFGQIHRGKNLFDLLYSDSAQGYFNGFVEKERQKNPTAFTRYPLFLQIIDDKKRLTLNN